MTDICCEITIAPEEIALELVQEIAELELAEVGVQGPQGIQGLAGGLTEYELLTIASNGQTAFNLAAVPALPHLSQLYLNGHKATYGLHYTINSAVLTWTTTPTLETSDDLEIYY